MVDHDPNGEACEDWKRAGYDSYETFIESKAGASPPDCFDPHAIQARVQGETCPACGRVHLSYTRGYWPMPKPPPFLADDEGSDDPANILCLCRRCHQIIDGRHERLTRRNREGVS